MYMTTVSLRVLLLLLLLLPGHCLESADGARDSSVCQTAVEFTRYIMLSLKTRTGAVVLPQPQVPAANVNSSVSSRVSGSVCEDQTLLRSLWSSVVRLTPLDQAVCLRDRAACLRTMARDGTVVLFWSGSSQDQQLVQMVLSGAGKPDKVMLLLVTVPSQRTPVHALATRLNTNVGTDVWMAEVNASSVTVTELYTKCASCSLTAHRTAQWTASGLKMVDSRTRQERRGDLGGITLRAVGVKVFPIYTAVENVNGTDRPVGGVFFELASALASDLNFRLNITLLDGYAYGKRRPDGTYTGMVGELQAGRADMTISEVSFTNAREQVIDYTQTVSVISRRVYVHVPTVLDSWLTRYSRGISFGMVALSLASVILLAVTQRSCEALLVRRRGREDGPEDSDDRKEERTSQEDRGEESSLANTFWAMIGLMLQQGADDTPGALSARIPFLSCLLLGLLLCTSYSATLISFLSSAGHPPPPFADLQGLLKLPDWSAGWKEGDLLENVLDWCALRNNPTPDCHTLSAVWSDHVLPDRRTNLVQTYEDGFKKVARGNYAFIAPNEAADYQLSKMAPEVACRVQKLDVKYAPGGIALGLQNHSPYKELFDQSLQRLYEAGVTEKLYRSILRPREVCGPQPAAAATLLQTLGAFLLLLAGLLLSCLLLAAERLISRYRRGSRRQVALLSLDRD